MTTIKKLERHMARVSALALDRERLYSVSDHRRLIQWDRGAVEVLNIRDDAHEDEIFSMALDDRFLYTASGDTTVGLWDKETLEKKIILKGAEAPLRSVTLTDELVLASATNMKVYIWLKSDFEVEGGVDRPHKEVELADIALSIHADGDYLYAGLCNQTVVVYSLADFSLTKTLEHKQKSFADIYFVNTDQENIYSASTDRSVHIWKKDSLEPVGKLDHVKPGVKAVCADTSHIYTGALDGVLRIWDKSTLDLVAEISEHEGEITDLVCDDEVVVSASLDTHMLYITKPDDWREFAKPEPVPEPEPEPEPETRTTESAEWKPKEKREKTRTQDGSGVKEQDNAMKFIIPILIVLAVVVILAILLSGAL